MTSVKRRSAGGPDHIARLLELASRRLRVDLDDLGGRFPGLRGAHFRLLNLLPDEGASHRVMAERATMTKQALGQLAAHLEAHGYIETLRDPSDRRVRIIRPTATGRRARAAAEDAIAELERTWASEVGARRYATFRRVIAELGERIVPDV